MQENRFRSARGSGLPFTQTNAQLRGTGPLVLPSAQGFEENLNERSVPLWDESSPQ